MENRIPELKKLLPNLEDLIPDFIKKSSKEYAGSCPHCGGDDRFFWIPDNLSGHCRQCEKNHDNLDIIMMKRGVTIVDLLKEYNLYDEPERKNKQGSPRDHPGTTPGLTRKLQGKKESAGTNEKESAKTKEQPKKQKSLPAWEYSKANDKRITEYFSSRNIHFNEDFPIPPALRFSEFKDKDTKELVLSIIAAVTNINKDTAVRATHRTFLDPDLKKLNRIMKGDIKDKGRGVWFYRKQSKNATHLIIGEGLETVLSAMQTISGVENDYAKVTGVAGIDSGKMEGVELPESVTELFILVDEDILKDGARKGYAGQKASLKLAKQFEKQRDGNIAWLVSPSDTCFTDSPVKKDFNNLSNDEIERRFAFAENCSEIDWKPPKPPEQDRTKDIGKLAQMQRRFVYMRNGNKMIDLEKPAQHAVMNVAEFKLAFRKKGTVFIQGAEKPVLAVNAFFNDENYRSVVGERFFPYKDKIYNDDGVNWFNPANFPDFPETADESKINKIKDHLDYLFPGDQIERFMDWLAWTIIRPDIRIKFTPLLISKHHRTGRGFLVELIYKLAGQWNCSPVEIEELAGLPPRGQYHNYLHNTVFCPMHEVKVSGSDAFAVDDAIRSKLTESILYLNLKYGDNGVFPVFANFLMMSNHRDALKLDKDDMRIEVFEHFSKSKVSEEDSLLPPEEQNRYYIDLYTSIENDEIIDQFYWYLKRHYEARKGDFNPMGSALMSKAKKRMIGGTQNDIEHIFNSAIELYTEDIITVKLIKDFMLSFMIDPEQLDMSIEDAEKTVEESKNQIYIMTKKKFVQLLDGKKIKVSGKSTRIYAIRNELDWVDATNKDIRLRLAKIDTQGVDNVPF